MRKLYSGARNARVLGAFVLGVLCLGTVCFAASERSKSRISPVLEDEVSFLSSNPAYDYAIPVIVKLSADSYRAAVRARLERIKMLPVVSSYATELTGREIARLLDSESVEYVTLDAAVYPADGSNGVGPKIELSNGMATIGVDQVQEEGYRGKGVVVALFDTGIGDHPDLNDSRVVAALDFTGDDVIQVKRNSDGHGHGTPAL